jgi:hypothetical protein
VTPPRTAFTALQGHHPLLRCRSPDFGSLLDCRNHMSAIMARTSDLSVGRMSLLVQKVAKNETVRAGGSHASPTPSKCNPQCPFLGHQKALVACSHLAPLTLPQAPSVDQDRAAKWVEIITQEIASEYLGEAGEAVHRDNMAARAQARGLDRKPAQRRTTARPLYPARPAHRRSGGETVRKASRTSRTTARARTSRLCPERLATGPEHRRVDRPPGRHPTHQKAGHAMVAR